MRRLVEMVGGEVIAAFILGMGSACLLTNLIWLATWIGRWL